MSDTRKAILFVWLNLELLSQFPKFVIFSWKILIDDKIAKALVFDRAEIYGRPCLRQLLNIDICPSILARPEQWLQWRQSIVHPKEVGSQNWYVLQKEEKESASIKGRLSFWGAMYYCCSCYSIVYRFAKIFFFDNGIEIKRREEMSRINFNICFCLDLLYFESNRKRPHYLLFRYLYI